MPILLRKMVSMLVKELQKNIVDKHKFISEFSERYANETHHIFMKSEFSKLRFLMKI